MKKTKFLFSLLMTLVMMAMSTQKMWAWSGSGTVHNPYVIRDAAELKKFADIVNGTNGQTRNTAACAELAADIELSGTWTPIGSSSYPYSGTFRGQGHTISGLNITATADNAGFFSYVNDGRIYTFTLVGSVNSNSNNVGSVVGTANGAAEIHNVYSSVNITMSAAKSHIGGIVGQILQSEGKVPHIMGCVYSGTMKLGSSTDSNGGIVGYCGKEANVQIEYCLFSGSISSSGSNPRIGGILGYADDENNQNFKSLSNCYCDGTLSPSSGPFVGAIAGYPRGNVVNAITNNTYKSGMATNALGNSKTSATTKAITISVTAGTGGKASHNYVYPNSSTPTKLEVKAEATTTGYYFQKWNDEDTNSSRKLDLTDDINLKASFDNHYTISVSMATGLGTTSGSGTYVYGEKVTIKVEPNPALHFVYWRKNDQLYDVTDPSFTITVTGNDRYFASVDFHSYGEWINDSEPTCVNEGSKHHFCKYAPCQKRQDESIPALKHYIDNPTWEWADDNTAATLTLHCTRPDCKYTITEQATDFGRALEVWPTCTEWGTMRYRASVASYYETEKYGRIYDGYKYVNDVEPLGHDYDADPEWTWVNGVEGATAKFTCKRDAEHTTTVDANIENEVKIAATCTEMGTTTYTAVVELNDKKYLSKSKDIVDIPITEHSYNTTHCCSGCKQLDAKYFYATGEVDNCYWGIYKEDAANGYADGEMVIFRGSFGQSWNKYRPTIPWEDYSDYIKKVRFDGRVFANSLRRAFFGCRNLVEVDFTNLNTEYVEDAESLFSCCDSLATINWANFNTENITNMCHMFSYCSSLESLDLSNFNTTNATDMRYMFYQCPSLKSLTIDNFDMQRADENSMFGNCDNLNELTLKSVPYLKAFNDQFYGEGKTVNYVLNDNSAIYTGTNNLPDATSTTYTRKNIKNQWGTIVVPFEVNGRGSDYDLYTLSSATVDELTLTRVNGTIPAGTPALICLKEGLAGNYDLTLTAASNTVSGLLAEGSSADGLQLAGTYATTGLAADDYFIANNKFWRAGDMSATVKAAPFRAYLKGTSAGAKSLSLNIDGESATGVDVLDMLNDADAEFYDVNGRRISKLQRGINIVKYGNGKTAKVNIK